MSTLVPPAGSSTAMPAIPSCTGSPGAAAAGLTPTFTPPYDNRKGVRYMKSALVAAILLVGGTSALAATSSAASWSVAQATATATGKIKIPFCKVFPASRDCVNGKLTAGSPHGPVAIVQAKCGVVAKDTLGRQRFICSYTTLNDYSEGNLMITVLGPSAFRWKTQ